jgi:hypothetical protein
LYKEESKEAHAVAKDIVSSIQRHEYYFLHPTTSRLTEEDVKELRGRHIASIEVKGSNILRIVYLI